MVLLIARIEGERHSRPRAAAHSLGEVAEVLFAPLADRARAVVNAFRHRVSKKTLAMVCATASSDGS